MSSYKIKILTLEEAIVAYLSHNQFRDDTWPPNPYQRTSERMHTLMMNACSKNDVDTAKLLLEAGWSMYYENGCYMEQIVESDAIDVAKLFVDLGYNFMAVDVFDRRKLLSSIDLETCRGASNEMLLYIIMNGARNHCNCDDCTDGMHYIYTRLCRRMKLTDEQQHILKTLDSEL